MCVAKHTLSRRAALGLITAGFAASLLPRPARADGHAGIVSFDGNDIVLSTARGLRRHVAGSGWRNLAAPGAFTALAARPDWPGHLAAGLDSGTIALSEDGGESWRRVSDGLPDATVGALAWSASVPGTVYAAVNGDGLWRSEDAGETWSFVMDRPWTRGAEREILSLVSVNVASGMGGIWIYAGTEAGLTRVPDCFCRWQDVVAGDAMDALVTGDVPSPEAPLPEGEPILALVSAHSAPEQLYAALPSGVWASTDGGVIWDHRSDPGAIALAVNPTNPNHIAAATAAELTQSRDGGATWATLAAV